MSDYAKQEINNLQEECTELHNKLNDKDEQIGARINELLAEIETARNQIRNLESEINRLEKSSLKPGFYWVRDAMTMGSPHYRVAELRQHAPIWLLPGIDSERSFASFVPVSPRLIDPVDALPEASPDAKV